MLCVLASGVFSSKLDLLEATSVHMCVCVCVCVWTHWYQIIYPCSLSHKHTHMHTHHTHHTLTNKHKKVGMNVCIQIDCISYSSFKYCHIWYYIAKPWHILSGIEIMYLICCCQFSCITCLFNVLPCFTLYCCLLFCSSIYEEKFLFRINPNNFWFYFWKHKK